MAEETTTVTATKAAPKRKAAAKRKPAAKRKKRCTQEDSDTTASLDKEQKEKAG